MSKDSIRRKRAAIRAEMRRPRQEKKRRDIERASDWVQLTPRGTKMFDLLADNLAEVEK